MAVVFRQSRHDCLQWGLIIDEEERVPVRAPNSYVARIAKGSTLLLGKFDITQGRFWSNNNGVRAGPIYEIDQEIDFLTKHQACTVIWMAYTAGQTLPVGAVIGGHVADGSVTHVARMTHNGREVLGYYHPKTKLAYYEQMGKQTATLMDILVLI